MQINITFELNENQEKGIRRRYGMENSSNREVDKAIFKVVVRRNIQKVVGVWLAKMEGIGMALRKEGGQGDDNVAGQESSTDE